MHCIHRSCKCFTLFIDVFSTFNNFVVQNIIRLDKISHFTTKHSTIRNHLCWNSTLKTFDAFHSFNLLNFLLIFHNFCEIFWVVISQPLNQKIIGFEFFTSHNSLQKSSQKLFTSFNTFFAFLFLFHWKRWNNYIWISFQ